MSIFASDLSRKPLVPVYKLYPLVACCCASSSFYLLRLSRLFRDILCPYLLLLLL
jgi:hypothetical protein